MGRQIQYPTVADSSYWGFWADLIGRFADGETIMVLTANQEYISGELFDMMLLQIAFWLHEMPLVPSLLKATIIICSLLLILKLKFFTAYLMTGETSKLILTVTYNSPLSCILAEFTNITDITVQDIGYTQ